MAVDLDPIILTFGGGINRRSRPFDLNPQECYDGQNFDLDHQFFALHRRRAFDLRASAPNAQAIRGYAQLVQADGTVTTLIQAGGDVYSWDGSSTFTPIGTCHPNSRLRGGKDQNFILDDIVIITDLEKLTIVKQWDGASFNDFMHNLSAPLYAKYCKVNNERAVFGSVRSGTDTPHVILASELSNANNLTSSTRAQSAGISAADPWYLPTPDLKPINGLETAYGQFVISTARGRLHVLSGADATDFALEPLYDGSALAGDEAIANIGNDLILGLPGRIETLSGTLNFGDVENDDVSSWIKPLVDSVTSWTIAYDRTNQKVYCFAANQTTLWVLHKHLLGGESKLSPWSKWVTDHDIRFQPSCVMTMIDPETSLESVFMGGPAGQIYKMDGIGGTDGGTADITMNRRSMLYRLPAAQIFDYTGSVIYRKQYEETMTITYERGGITTGDEVVEVPLSAASPAIAVYNGNSYYGGSGSGAAYYNAGFEGRLTKRDYSLPGLSDFVQIKTEISGAVDVEIHELQINFRAAPV